MTSNRIRKLRTQRGLTQNQLAKLARTSQQQVARIENGQQTARFDLAVRLCEALGASMENIFPIAKTAARTFANMSQTQKGTTMLNANEPVAHDFMRGGIDLDPRLWLFKVQLRDGSNHLFPIDSAEKARVFGAVQRTRSEAFVVFDSRGRRVVLNLDHVPYCHFLFEAGPSANAMEEGQVKQDARSEESEGHEVIAYLATGGGEPLRFGVDMDEPDDDGLGQLGSVVFWAENYSPDESLVFHIEDEDGEDIFLRASDVALLSMPLDLTSPFRTTEDDVSRPADGPEA